MALVEASDEWTPRSFGSDLSAKTAKGTPRRRRPDGQPPIQVAAGDLAADDRSSLSGSSHNQVYLTKEEYRQSLLGPQREPLDEDAAQRQAARRAEAKQRREAWLKEREQAYRDRKHGAKEEVVPLDPVVHWQRPKKPPLPPGTCLNAPGIEQRNTSDMTRADELAAKFKPENVFMMISTMKKNMHLLAFQTEGLRALRALSATEFGRQVCLTHKAVGVIIGARDAHVDNEECQILCVEVLSAYARHVDSCWAIQESKAVQEGFSAQFALFQSHETIARMLLAIIRPVAAKTTLQGVFLDDIELCRRIKQVLVTFRNNPELLAEGLAVLESLGLTFLGRRILIDLEMASFAIELMQQYRLVQTANPAAEQLVLQGAIGVLCYVCRDRQGCDQIITSQGLLPILNALKVVVGADNLQLRGLVMISSLAKVPEARKQLEEVPGAWQWLTQGTDQGNNLVHYQKGSLYNPGWSIGDSPNVTALDQQPCVLPPSNKWTSQRLREFMGVKYTWQHSNLGLSTMAYEPYFDLVHNLGLLPFPLETKDKWFQRMHRFEQANGVNLRSLAEREAKGYHGERQEEHHIALAVTDDGLLNWPDSRPNSRAPSRVSSRGETLVTYAKQESRVASRSSSRASRARAASRGDSRGSLHSAGSGFGDHKELSLTMRDVSKLIDLQDASGFGVSGTRPYSRGDAQNNMVFGVSRPQFFAREGSRQSSRQHSRQAPSTSDLSTDIVGALGRPGTAASSEAPPWLTVEDAPLDAGGNAAAAAEDGPPESRADTPPTDVQPPRSAPRVGFADQPTFLDEEPKTAREEGGL